MNMITKIAEFYFKYYGVFILDKENYLPETYNLDPRFEFKILNIDDLFLFKKLDSKKKNYNLYVDRLKSSDFVCFAIIEKSKSEIAYYSWLNFSNRYFVHEINKVMDFKKEKSVLFQDDNTIEPYLRLGLHKYVMQKRVQYSFENQVNRIYIVIYLRNVPALRTVKKIGFKQINFLSIYLRKGTLKYTVKKIMKKTNLFNL